MYIPLSQRVTNHAQIDGAEVLQFLAADLVADSGSGLVNY